MTDTTVEDAEHRLPTGVSPTLYDLRLRPDLDTATFAGSVSVDVEVSEATDTIVLNAADLTIGTAWIERDGERLDYFVRHRSIRFAVCHDQRRS
jgi:aminopeptidase N